MLFGRTTVDGAGDVERGGGDPLTERGLGGGEVARAMGEEIVAPAVRDKWETGEVGRTIPVVRRAT